MSLKEDYEEKFINFRISYGGRALILKHLIKKILNGFTKAVFSTPPLTLPPRHLNLSTIKLIQFGFADDKFDAL